MINFELANEEYHARPELSSSDGKAVDQKSVRHWWLNKGIHKKPTPSMIIGTAAHEFVFEPEANTIIRGGADRRGNQWKEAQAEADAAGKLLLTSGDYDHAMEMANAVRNHGPAMDLLDADDAMSEFSVFNQDPDTGLHLRCRPDWYSPSKKRLIDLKTTLNASPQRGGFEKQFFALSYPLQCAWYEQVLYNEGMPVDEIIFICVENEFPYCVQVFRISWEVIAYGRKRMRRALNKINRAVDTSVYTTGWPNEHIINLPEWLEE